MGGRISWVVVLFDFFKAPPKKGEPHRFGSFLSLHAQHTLISLSHTHSLACLYFSDLVYNDI